MQGLKFEINVFVLILLACELFDATRTGGLVTSSFKYIIMIWSFAYYVLTVVNFQKEPAVIKALTIFYSSLAIYGIIVLVGGESFQAGIRNSITIVPINYLYKTSWSLLPIFAFYHFAKTGQLTKQFMLKWLGVFIVVATISYFSGLRHAMMRNDEEETTNNAGYLIVSLIPMFVFLKKRSWVQYLLIGGALLLTIMSVKRGAVLVGLVAVAVYFRYLFKNSTLMGQMNLVFALIIAASGIFYTFDRLLTSSAYFQERMDETLEGDTSGRDVIQGFLINYYMNQYTLTEQLIGKGANATLEVFGMFAHNDWIELGINQGLLGILFYLFFWIAFVKLLLRWDVPPEVKTVLTMIFAIYFLKTFFSMSYSVYTFYACMALGYCIAVACDAGVAKENYLLDLEDEEGDLYDSSWEV